MCTPRPASPYTPPHAHAYLGSSHSPRPHAHLDPPHLLSANANANAWHTTLACAAGCYGPGVGGAGAEVPSLVPVQSH
ncbi:hypothetical protein JB92DRAFT_2839633 [Gautieria morchelliformis]|nr:hypothetical protein JB92DRAFT_2839633 [Gautieria morchelliformis]